MITVIAAVASNGIIGGRNALLWHITEDMRRFRSLTSGHPVVMGRLTYESLGGPLPNRENIVVTRSDIEFEGCRTVHSLSEAVNMFGPEEEVFIIGGAQIYGAALPIADRMYLTRVEHDSEGDTLFPSWDSSEGECVASERHEHGVTYPYPFVFEVYERRR